MIVHLVVLCLHLQTVGAASRCLFGLTCIRSCIVRNLCLFLVQIYDTWGMRDEVCPPVTYCKAMLLAARRHQDTLVRKCKRTPGDTSRMGLETPGVYTRHRRPTFSDGRVIPSKSSAWRLQAPPFALVKLGSCISCRRSGTSGTRSTRGHATESRPINVCGG